MLLVKTYLDRSKIHGIGVFAGAPIRKDTKIWCFVEGFDRAWSPRAFARLPKAARDFLQCYGYQVDGEIIFTVDHDHHMNHAERPNTYLRGGYTLARRNIRKGEELTVDYREFDPALCAAFLKELKPPSLTRRSAIGRSRPSAARRTARPSAWRARGAGV